MRQLVGIIVIILLVLGVWALVGYAERSNAERYSDVAKNWIETSSGTYVYDGSDLELTKSEKPERDVYQYTFRFNSSHAGYGDRADEMVAQVVTPHITVLRIEKGKVVSVVTDGVYEELTKELTGTPDTDVGNERDERIVELFFYEEKADLDETGNVMCSADAVVPVTRTIKDYAIEKHIETLLAGPSAEEKERGLSSEYPLKSLRLESANLDDKGVLTLKFNDPDNSTTGGSCRVGLLSAQLIKTAESITGVKSVKVEPEELFQP